MCLPVQDRDWDKNVLAAVAEGLFCVTERRQKGSTEFDDNLEVWVAGHIAGVPSMHNRQVNIELSQITWVNSETNHEHVPTVVHVLPLSCWMKEPDDRQIVNSTKMQHLSDKRHRIERNPFTHTHTHTHACTHLT